MARIQGKENIKAYIKKYSGKGVDFFTLKDDNDTARVRFLHTDDNDLDIHLVHQVEIEGKEKWVECLEEDCPFCTEFGAPTVKTFLYLYDLSDEKVKMWERGSSIVDFILGYIDKYGFLNNRNYEIVRHGKKGDNKTTYQLFPEDKEVNAAGIPVIRKLKDPKADPKDPKAEWIEEELPKKPETIGRFVLSMDKDEMEAYIAGTKPQERGSKSGKKANGPGF
jgi:hypothetical protein